MGMFRQFAPSAVRQLLLLFALAIVAPTVSRALVFMQGQIAPWATLCSAADAGARSDPAAPLRHLADHCPACHLQTDDLAPPVAATGGVLPLPAGHARLPWAQAPQPTTSAWALAQPRAPPLAA